MRNAEKGDDYRCIAPDGSWIAGYSKNGRLATRIKVSFGKTRFYYFCGRRVLDMKTTRTGGNLVMPSNSDAKEIQSRIHSNICVRIRGKLLEFNGKQEIKVLGWQRCRVNQVVVRSDGRA